MNGINLLVRLSEYLKLMQKLNTLKDWITTRMVLLVGVILSQEMLNLKLANKLLSVYIFLILEPQQGNQPQVKPQAPKPPKK